MTNSFATIYQLIVEDMADGVVFIDENDIIRICNPAAERIRHVKAERIIGKSIFTIHPRKMHHRIRELIASLKSGKISSGSRIIFVQKRYFSNSYTAIKSPGGDFLGTVLISRDVTETQRLNAENESLKNPVLKDKMKCLVAKSNAAQKLLEMVVSLGAIDSTVLVCGENGTGKECVVELLHQHSLRRDGPLIKVNCAALPENLIESELFGYIAGAFTGAIADRKGKFELAHGGTLFLDEIGDLPPAAQAKLLRVLQERTVQPLGGDSEVLVDVRIVAATNHILADDVVSGQFREDLFYRLNVIQIEVPPLRERAEDIEPLAQMFLEKFSIQMNKKPIRHLSAQARQMLLVQRFPGNVRQLEHAMERAVALSSGELILPDDLPKDLLDSAAIAPSCSCNFGHELKDAIGFFERDYIVQALLSCNQKKGEAALKLGISRKSLWQKIRRYHLDGDNVT